MNAETVMMERILHILKRFWTSIRKTRARVLARMYSNLRKKSSPVRMGKYTIFYETYCRRIEEACADLNVIIPEQARRQPYWFERRFMSWRFGWPEWPVRMARYNGKMLEEVSMTVDEMARSCQYVWDKAEKQERPIPRPQQQLRTRVVNPPQKPVIDTVKPAVAPQVSEPVIQQKPPVTTVAGAIMDNSF